MNTVKRQNEWQQIVVPSESEEIHNERLWVNGGWLIRSIVVNSVAMTFMPDPNHLWLSEDQPDLLGTATELNEIGTHSMGISAGHDNKTDWKDEPFDFGKEIYEMCNNYNKVIANMPNIIG